jgi:hypothetical protein
MKTIYDTLLRAAELRLQRERNLNRPSVLLAVEVSCYVTEAGSLHYAADYSSLRATGETPELACENFDHLWATGDLA